MLLVPKGPPVPVTWLSTFKNRALGTHRMIQLITTHFRTATLCLCFVAHWAWEKKGTIGKTNQGFNAELNTAKPHPLKRTYLKPLFLLRQNCLPFQYRGKSSERWQHRFGENTALHWCTSNKTASKNFHVPIGVWPLENTSNTQKKGCFLHVPCAHSFGRNLEGFLWSNLNHTSSQRALKCSHRAEMLKMATFLTTVLFSSQWILSSESSVQTGNGKGNWRSTGKAVQSVVLLLAAC